MYSIPLAVITHVNPPALTSQLLRLRHLHHPLALSINVSFLVTGDAILNGQSSKGTRSTAAATTSAKTQIMTTAVRIRWTAVCASDAVEKRSPRG